MGVGVGLEVWVLGGALAAEEVKPGRSTSTSLPTGRPTRRSCERGKTSIGTGTGGTQNGARSDQHRKSVHAAWLRRRGFLTADRPVVAPGQRNCDIARAWLAATAQPPATGAATCGKSPAADGPNEPPTRSTRPRGFTMPTHAQPGMGSGSPIAATRPGSLTTT